MSQAAGVLALLAIALFVGLLIWLHFRNERLRREGFMLVAAKLGLTYERDDPYDTTNLPFALFSKGDRRSAENVLHGTIGGMQVRLFDYEYYVTHHNPKGPDTTSTYRFSCALGWFDADCPHLTLDREGLMTRLADKLGFRDIEFESEEFNRAWQVASEDRRFASAFVDAGMMAWLLDEGDIAAYEVIGPLLLCSTDRLKPPEYENLFEVLRRFRSHVPDVVSSLYPRTRSAEA